MKAGRKACSTGFQLFKPHYKMDNIYKYSPLSKVNLEVRNLKDRLLIVETQLTMPTDTMVCDLTKPLSTIDRTFEPMLCVEYWSRELSTVTEKIARLQRFADALAARYVANQKRQA
jgi:hypothetical protein